LVLLKGIHILGFQFQQFATHEPGELRRNDGELLDLLATHRVAPHIGASFSLDDVAAALQFVADGRAIGKVVLDINGPLTLGEGGQLPQEVRSQ
jgi:NADPH2:quinone reductase